MSSHHLRTFGYNTLGHKDDVVILNDGCKNIKITRKKLPPGAKLLKYNSHNGGMDTYKTQIDNISKKYPKRYYDKEYSNLLQTTIQLKIQNRSMATSARELLDYKKSFHNLLIRQKQLLEQQKKEKEQHKTSLHLANDYIQYLQNELAKSKEQNTKMKNKIKDILN
jgi:hypothetical protein